MDKRKKREKSMILALGRSFLASRFAARRTGDVKALWRVKIINIILVLFIYFIAKIKVHIFKTQQVRVQSLHFVTIEILLYSPQNK